MIKDIYTSFIWLNFFFHSVSYSLPITRSHKFRHKLTRLTIFKEANVGILNSDTFNKNNNVLQPRKFSNLKLKQEMQALPLSNICQKEIPHFTNSKHLSPFFCISPLGSLWYISLGPSITYEALGKISNMTA